MGEALPLATLSCQYLGFALRVQIWILRCHCFISRCGDEAVIGCYESQRWQAMRH